MTLPIAQIDAFTSQPFAGNPAAVCVLSEFPEDSWMQSVAREMNLSETAFVVPRESMFDLRWFTPRVEVDLCGHATLASAHHLWATGGVPPEREIVFATRSGRLSAVLRGQWIEMDFPAEPLISEGLPLDIARALGAESLAGGMNRFDLLVELESEDAVRELAPRMDLLRGFPVRGIIVTAEARTEQFDFISRFFAPSVGVDEDPVTGSAHCCLGPYWANRLGRSELVGYQASERGGVVRVHSRGDRVQLQGQAITVLEGHLLTGE